MTSRRLVQEFITNLKVNLRNMLSHKNTSVTTVPPQIDNSRTSPSTYSGVEHTPALQSAQTSQTHPCKVLPLSIPVDDKPNRGTVPGFLHLPTDHSTSTPTKPTSQSRVQTAAILLSGAGGGVVGPSSIYLSIADKLASLHDSIPVLRLDYRFPARTRPCNQDVISAIRYLEDNHQISKFVLVGWSFGSAPVFTVAATEPAIVGCATIAGQTAETGGVRLLSPRPLLLLHGTGDRILSHRCSESLYQGYGSAGRRRIELFEGDDHALTRGSRRAEVLLCEFIVECAGVRFGEGEREEIVERELVGDGEKIELMRKGGDLRGVEDIN